MTARRITTTGSLGSAMRDRRKQLGWTQAHLARLSSTTQAMISNLERGRANPQLDTILALAAALQLEIRIGPPDPSDPEFPWDTRGS